MSNDRLTQLLHELDDLSVDLPAPDPVRARGRALRRRRQAAAAAGGVGLAVAGVAAALALTGGTTSTLEQLPPAQPVAPSVQPSAPPPSPDADASPDPAVTGAPQATAEPQTTADPAATPGAPVASPPGQGPATPGAQPSTGGGDLVVDGVDTARLVGFADRDGQVVVTTNRISILSGEAANAYAAERGWEVPVPNDQLVVDDNPRLREYPVRPDAPVTLTVPLADDPNGDPTSTTLPGLRALLAGRSDGDAYPWQLVVEDGVVVEFRMLYQP